MGIVNYFEAMGLAKKEYNRYLEPVCKRFRLTQNELAVVLFLYSNPGLDRAADIVSCRGIAKSHVSLAVSNLEQRCILARRSAPTDRRSVHLELTWKGQEIAQEGRNRQQLFFEALYAGISQEELDQLRALNQKILINAAHFGKSGEENPENEHCLEE